MPQGCQFLWTFRFIGDSAVSNNQFGKNVESKSKFCITAILCSELLVCLYVHVCLLICLFHSAVTKHISSRKVYLCTLYSSSMYSDMGCFEDYMWGLIHIDI